MDSDFFRKNVSSPLYLALYLPYVSLAASPTPVPT